MSKIFGTSEVNKIYISCTLSIDDLFSLPSEKKWDISMAPMTPAPAQSLNISPRPIKFSFMRIIAA